MTKSKSNRSPLTAERKAEVAEIVTALRFTVDALERAEREDQLEFAMAMIRELAKKKR